MAIDLLHSCNYILKPENEDPQSAHTKSVAMVNIVALALVITQTHQYHFPTINNKKKSKNLKNPSKIQQRKSKEKKN